MNLKFDVHLIFQLGTNIYHLNRPMKPKKFKILSPLAQMTLMILLFFEENDLTLTALKLGVYQSNQNHVPTRNLEV